MITVTRSVEDAVAAALTVDGYMDPPELRWLAETAAFQAPGAVWVELGSWMGRSATAVSAALPADCTLHLIDDFSGPTTREKPNVAACERRLRATMACMQARSPGQVITLTVGDSVILGRAIRHQVVDVVFIDGDHKFQHVVDDIEAWRQAIKPGGLLCGHDFTNPCGVADAVRQRCPGFVLVPGTSLWWARC